MCSIAASPHERDVVFAAVGNDAWETDNGGASWIRLGTPDSRRQGRIPFVETNARTVPGARSRRSISGMAMSGFIAAAVEQSARRWPPLPDGNNRCCAAADATAGWDGPFTRSAGGHDDVAAIVRPGVSENACPVLFSSDGGVYFNTKETSPDCHRPFWQQPNVTPHALWLWALAGSNQPGVLAEDLYFGNQDNGSLGRPMPGRRARPGRTGIAATASMTAPIFRASSTLFVVSLPLLEIACFFVIQEWREEPK